MPDGFNLTDETRKMLQDFLRLSRREAGQEKPVLPELETRWGLSPEEAQQTRQAVAQPESQTPVRKQSLLEKIGRPIGYYVTHAIPGAAEALTRPLIKAGIEQLYGVAAREAYEKSEKETVRDFDAVRKERGLFGAISEWLRDQSEVREKRPGLFWGEKFFGEIILDPTTWMGWGVASKIPVLGKLGLGAVFDTAPKAAAQAIFWPAKVLRGGATAISSPILRRIIPFAKSEKAVAASVGDKVRQSMSELIGTEAILGRSKSATKGAIEHLQTLGRLDLVDDETVDAAMGMARAQRASAVESVSKSLDDGEEIARRAMEYGAAKTPETGDFLVDLAMLEPEEFIAKMGSISEKMTSMELQVEWETWLRGTNSVVRVLTEFMGHQGTWFERRITKPLVLEPARALLVFANYGPFNLFEDVLRVIQGGHFPTPIDYDFLARSWAGRALPSSLTNPSEYGQIGKLFDVDIKKLPWPLRLPGIAHIAGPLNNFNLRIQNFSSQIRRGYWHREAFTTMQKLAQESGIEELSAWKGIKAAIMRPPPGDPHVVGTLGDMVMQLAYRGEFDAIPAAIASHSALKRPMLNKAMEGMPNLHPVIRTKMVDRVADQGMGVLEGPGKEALRAELRNDAFEVFRISTDVLDAKVSGYVKMAQKALDAAPDVIDPDEVVTLTNQAISMVSSYLLQPKKQHDLFVPMALQHHGATKGALFGGYFKEVDKVAKSAKTQFAALGDIISGFSRRLARVEGVEPTKAHLRELSKFLDSKARYFENYQGVHLNINKRFFPDNRAGAEWTKQIDRLVDGDMTALKELPKEWREVLERKTHGVTMGADYTVPGVRVGSEPVGVRAAAKGATTVKAKQELRIEIERTFREAYDEANFVGYQVTQGKPLDDLNELIEAMENSGLMGPRVAPQAHKSLSALEAVVEPATTRLGKELAVLEDKMATGLLDEIDTAFELFEGVARKMAATPNEQKVLAAWLNTVHEATKKLGKGPIATLKANATKAADSADTALKQAFTNYSDNSVMDEYMKTLFPFWQYQSRSWPWLVSSMVSHPGIATALAPQGRFWQVTDEGYIPTSILDMQVMPLRGTVYGRMKRRWRGGYPQRLSGWAGRFEGIMENMESWGFFPAMIWTIPIEMALSLTGGGASAGAETLSGLVEGLPAVPASIMDGVIALSRIAGPGWTNTFAENIFPSKFRSYYMAKMLYEAHGVSVTEARKQDHEDWIADAYQAVALRQMVEEQMSLTRINPDKYAATKERFDVVMASELDVELDQVKKWREEARIAGVRLSEIVPMSRIQRAKLGMIEGIEAISEAGRVLSPEERSGYLRAKSDYYTTRETVREDHREQQEMDDSLLQAGEISAKMWRENLYSRTQEYRALENMLLSEYYGQIGRTDAERRALMEKFGMVPSIVHPVDTVLDAFFSMLPPMANDGTSDWGALSMAREELLDSLPEETGREVRDYLSRNQTPLVREFFAGSPKALPYWRTEEGIVAMYSSFGMNDWADYYGQVFESQKKLFNEWNFMLRQGEVVPVALMEKSRTMDFIANKAKALYRRWLIVDPSAPGHDPELGGYLLKFYEREI